MPRRLPVEDCEECGGTGYVDCDELRGCGRQDEPGGACGFVHPCPCDGS